MRCGRRAARRAGLGLALVAVLAGPLDAASALPGDQRSPQVAFDGTSFLVVWQDARSSDSSSAVYGARVNPAGAVLDPAGFRISTTSGSDRSPQVVFDGMRYLVVWDTGFGIYGARVTTAGEVLDRIEISVGVTRRSSPAVSFDGTNYLVTWSDERSGAGADVYAARVTQAGAVLDPAGVAIATAADDQRSPRAAFDGASHLVVWDDDRDASAGVYGRRVSTVGLPVDDAFPIPTAPDAGRDAAIVFAGSASLVAWSAGGDVRAARVSPAGTVFDVPAPTISPAAAGDRDSPGLSFDGTSYLAVWRERSAATGETDIGASRLSPAVVPLDPTGIAVASAAGPQQDPAVAFGAGVHLVAWSDGRAGLDLDVRAARVSPGGEVLDPLGIPVPRARDSRPPQTRIVGGPTGRQTERKATFAFRSSEGGSTFECRLDRRLWRPCSTPRTYRGLALGPHVVRVRARDRSGNVDPTPARRGWRVAAAVPGRLAVVPGRTERSGRGPLRRYVVEIEEGVGIDGPAAARVIDRILADRRGWGGSGRVSFQRVSSGPISFRITLAGPRTVDRLCRPLNTRGRYSCSQGGRAALNLGRWRTGAAPFTSVASYRAHLVNHEVGHLLGRGHHVCRAAGARAPVMAQQTINLGGCRANSWPLSWERG